MIQRRQRRERDSRTTTSSLYSWPPAPDLCLPPGVRDPAGSAQAASQLTRLLDQDTGRGELTSGSSDSPACRRDQHRGSFLDPLPPPQRHQGGRLPPTESSLMAVLSSCDTRPTWGFMCLTAVMAWPL